MDLSKRLQTVNLNNHRKKLCLLVVNSIGKQPDNMSELFEFLCNHYLESKEGAPVVKSTPLDETVKSLQQDDNSVDIAKELQNTKDELEKVLKRLGDKHLEFNAVNDELQALKNATDNISVDSTLHPLNASNPLYSDLDSRLLELHRKTSTFIRECYKDESLRDLTHTELVFLMLDYVERDPSEEFPFEEAVVKIFAEPKTVQTYVTGEE